MAEEDAKYWTTSSNEAVKLSLVHSDGSEDAFGPVFTYPIFGDEETIFGYRNLRVNLSFKADTLKPSLDIKYDDKFKTVGETKADDLEEALSPWLPRESSKRCAGFRSKGIDKTLQTASLSPRSNGTSSVKPFEPPGECLQRYTADDCDFVIHTAKLTDMAARTILQNVQILIPMFIEGGSLLDLSDPEWSIDRWRLYITYQVLPGSRYAMVGYSTVYRLFFMDKTKSTTPVSLQEPSLSDAAAVSSLPCRARISQFLILPKHQTSGHGSRLYTAMVRHFLKDPHISEITVEDPNESFDDMRDVNDLVRLRKEMPAFESLSIDRSIRERQMSRSEPLPVDTWIPRDTISALLSQSKIAPRQFHRLVEMQLLSQIPSSHCTLARITRKDRASDPNDRAYYFWRLLVKRRLYKHNADALSQLEVEERIEKLDETIVGVQKDYVRLLELAKNRMGKWGNDAAPLPKSRGLKRKVVDDDEDDEEDSTANPNKLAKAA